MVSRLESVQERLLDDGLVFDLTQRNGTTFTWLLRKGLFKGKLLCSNCNKYDMKRETDKSKADLRHFNLKELEIKNKYHWMIDYWARRAQPEAGVDAGPRHILEKNNEKKFFFCPPILGH